MIKNIITRMKLWFMPNELKNCKKCCLTCRYFDDIARMNLLIEE